MTSPLPPPPVDPSRELHRQACRLGAKPFLRLPEAVLSWQEVDERVGRLAAGFVERDLGPNSVVMTAGGSASTQLFTWFAAQRIGAMWAPLNPLLSGRPLEVIASNTRPDVVVIDQGSTAGLGALGLPTVDVADLSADYALLPSSRPHSPEGRAKLMFTSGTTGDPKGVLWSRRCEAVWADAYARELLDVAEGEGLFTCLPLSHVTGQGTVVAAVKRGAVLTLADGFSPFRFWQQVREADARRMTYVGTILTTLLKRRPSPEEREHGLDRVVGAGAPVSRWAEIEDRFGVVIMETWGQTESAGCYTRPERLPQRPGSVGCPCDRFEIRLDDPDGGSELLLRPTEHGAIFDGYLRTDGSVESPYDEAGWYHTGDVMRQGADGDLEFVVRLRESIRRRGEIIASTLIEDTALEHDGVAEAAVVGVMAADGADEEIKLCCTGVGSAAIDPVELHGFLRARLPAFMLPRYIEIMADLPKTPSTRVQKFKLVSIGGAWDARHRRAHPLR